jgi:hypothetical protein
MRLSISVLAVTNAEDTHHFTIYVETSAEVTYAKAELRRVNALQLFDVARTGFRKALDGSLNAALLPYRARPDRLATPRSIRSLSLKDFSPTPTGA